MPGHAEDIHRFYTETERLSRGIDLIDPEDPTYKAIFDRLPLTGTEEEIAKQKTRYIKAIEDIASLGGFDPSSYGKQIVNIAIEHGLADQGTRRLDKKLFSLLKDRAIALRGIFNAKQFGAGSMGRAMDNPAYHRRRI